MNQIMLGPKIGSGWTAEIYEYGQGKALKLFQPRVPLQWIQHEYKSTKMAQDAGLPVPHIYELIDYQGRQAIVMERINGKSMLDGLMFTNNKKKRHYACVLAELQVSVNAVKITEPALTLRHKLENRINSESVLPPQIKAACLEILRNLPAGDSLCHYDLHPGNVLLTDKGPVIIDWMAACTGDPTADIARTLALCTLPPVPKVFEYAVHRLLKPFIEAYYEKIKALRPVNEKTLELWKIPVLASRISEERSPARKKMLLGVVAKRLKAAAI